MIISNGQEIRDCISSHHPHYVGPTSAHTRPKDNPFYLLYNFFKNQTHVPRQVLIPRTETTIQLPLNVFSLIQIAKKVDQIVKDKLNNLEKIKLFCLSATLSLVFPIVIGGIELYKSKVDENYDTSSKSILYSIIASFSLLTFCCFLKGSVSICKYYKMKKQYEELVNANLIPSDFEKKTNFTGDCAPIIFSESYFSLFR